MTAHSFLLSFSCASVAALVLITATLPQLFLLAFVFLFLLSCLWIARCESRVWTQREKLRDTFLDYPFYRPIMFLLYEVDVDKHLFRLVTLRDPWVLYPEEFRDIARELKL